MHSDMITPLLCKKNNISYILFDKNYIILEIDENVLDMADSRDDTKKGRDIRDSFWEFIGLEPEIETLFHHHNKKNKFVEIPMICKNNIYYNIEIELCEIKQQDTLIAYFTKKTNFLLNYAKMIQDVNQKTLALHQNEKAKEEHYNNLINNKLITFNVDLDGFITKVNTRCSYFFDITESEILGRHYSNFFEARESNIEDCKVVRAINKEGVSIFLHTDIIPINHLNEDSIYEYMAICQDITYLKEIEQELEYAVDHDTLTELPNRSFLLKQIDIAISSTKDTFFALCFIDLDKFKQINDNYGHHAGDMLLKHLSKLLQNLVRDGDIVARIGGDEFVILFKNVKNKNYVVSAIKRIKSMIKSTPLIYSQEEVIAFDCSMGLSYYPEDGSNATDLLIMADKKMYKEKRVTN